MDALILSCGTGGGHDSAGKAILEELQKRGHRAVMFNPYNLKSSRLSGGIDKSYISTVQNVPRIFGVVYHLGNWYRKLPFRSPVYFINKPMVSYMQAYLAENHFDVVIMPHLFPAEILTNMKQHGLPIPKTIFVATDYVCIPFTEETECDAYIVPTDELADDFTRRGIPKEKLYPYGIPTHSRFSENEYRGEIKRQLGLDADKKYILITGGSMGGGKIERAIDKIESYCRDRNDTELVVVCGSNQELYNRLKERYNQTITVIGYTDEMSSYMKACHLFITKPGGLSSTEAAVCGVPILHTSPIPGCESHNALYFSRHGMSISGDITDSTIALIDDLLNNEQRISMMIDSQKTHINPRAASDICDLAERMTAQEQRQRSLHHCVS